jgi:Protein of unknown function (DUF3105)
MTIGIFVTAACGSDAKSPDAAAIVDAMVLPDSPASCQTEVVTHIAGAAQHVPICSPQQYPTNPPAFGDHYPSWAKYQVWSTPVPAPFWVHNLEHGGVVVTYNCADGCAADVAALTSFLAARPKDPTCSDAVRNRFLVTPNAALTKRFAVSAWGVTLTSNCFDLAALGAFIDANYAKGPENLCGDGLATLPSC